MRHVTDAQPHHVHDVPGTSRPSPTDDAAEAEEAGVDVVDLDAVERELAAVEVALERLNEGTYWTDEVTGAPIPDHVLADDPTARRA